MTTSEVFPLPDTPERVIFENAYKDQNALLMANVLLDTETQALRVQYAKTGDTSYIQERVAAMREKTKETLLELNTFSSSWTDYYRLLSGAAMLEERIRAPHLFAQPGHHKERHDIINGVSGVTVDILTDALTMFDASRDFPTERAELLGVINEQTALALLNRTQDPKRLALPPYSADDMLRQVDIEYFMRRRGELHHVTIQVKSNPPLALQQSLRQRGVILITARELGNLNTSKETARLLVEENQHGLEPADTSQLDNLSRNLVRQIEQQIG